MVLRKALEKTNLGLYEESMEDPEREGMGSTLVAATIEDDMMYVANVGGQQTLPSAGQPGPDHA